MKGHLKKKEQKKGKKYSVIYDKMRPNMYEDCAQIVYLLRTLYGNKTTTKTLQKRRELKGSYANVV